MNMNNINMSPSEKLNMLLDGETSGIEPSEVFYELSNNPELQQEFLDIMKMKQMMSGVTESPPEHLRKGILAVIGLGGSGIWYYLQNSGVMAATSAFVTSKAGTALIATMFGVFATFMVMNNNDSPKKDNNNITSQTNVNSIPLSINVPTVSSYDKGTTKANKSFVRNTESKYIASSNITPKVSEKNINMNANLLVTNSDPAISTPNEVNIDLNSTPNKMDFNDQYFSSMSPEQKSGFIVNPANRVVNYDDYDRQMLFSLQGKGITNNSLQTPELSTTEAPAINDIGISLMYLVSDNLEVGLEFGQEFLVKRVKAGNFSSEESMLENQLTFWGGLKVNYIFNNMEILPNLRPTTSLLLGGTSRGWVTKASAGLVYDFSNKLSVFGGPEWTTGIYQFESNILSTHKWGFNYGVALRF